MQSLKQRHQEKNKQKLFCSFSSLPAPPEMDLKTEVDYSTTPR